MTRAELLEKIDEPGELEKLYQNNKAAFKKEFNLIYPDVQDRKLAAFWHERLNYEDAEISWGSKRELGMVIFASLLAGLIAKLPAILSIDEASFYQRNIGFIVFPILTIYFSWKNGISKRNMLFTGLIILIALVFINLLPANNKSDTLVLACVHLPLFLWAVLGVTYIGYQQSNTAGRLDFLRYNGDLVIMTTLILIGGGILTAITIGLFQLISLNIEKFYTEYIVVFGLSAVPVVATYITQTNPHLVNRVSPVIAKIFSPLVLITLVVYLTAILVSGKDPYQDREFLMIFNFLLIGVMAIILFSVSETFKKKENRAGSYILLALSVVTVIVNCIALSAILFRISAWGITANRLAVLGGNILILSNLLLVAFRLFRYVSGKAGISEVENAIAKFLPVYIIWAIVVIFIFPFLFRFE